MSALEAAIMMGVSPSEHMHEVVSVATINQSVRKVKFHCRRK